MSNIFALDLRVARKKSGLTQADLAHLLGASRGKVSHLERGATVPTVRDICTLSMVYGKSFESLFAPIFEEIADKLNDRLSNLPDAPKGWLGRFNRKNTLSKLAAQISERGAQNHGSA
jgi:transcriptional regulator with XRE-family HTH domain